MNRHIAVYTSATCPYCVMLKRFLDEKGLPYEERNISLDRRYIADLQELGINGVPVTVIDEQEVVIGYQPEEILALVGSPNGSN